MNFLKHQRTLFFFVVSLIINLTIGITTVKASSPINVDNTQVADRKINFYVGLGNRVNTSANFDSLFQRYGIESSLANTTNLTSEFGVGKVCLTDIKDIKTDKYLYFFNLGLEQYHEHYIAEAKIELFLSDVLGISSLTAKIGNKYNVDNSFYLRPKFATELTKVNYKEKHSDLSSSSINIGPELVIGTEIFIPNTVMSLNPEFYLAYNFDLIGKSTNKSIIGTSININIGKFNSKIDLGCSSRIVDSKIETKNTMSIRFGIAF